MFGYREYDHNVCVDENFIQKQYKNENLMKKIISNSFGSVRLLTNSLNRDLFMVQVLGYKPSQKTLFGC